MWVLVPRCDGFIVARGWIQKTGIRGQSSLTGQIETTRGGAKSHACKDVRNGTETSHARLIIVEQIRLVAVHGLKEDLGISPLDRSFDLASIGVRLLKAPAWRYASVHHCVIPFGK